MTLAARRRGAPLVALVLIPGCWIAVRVMLTASGQLPPVLAEAEDTLRAEAGDIVAIEADAAVGRGPFVPATPPPFLPAERISREPEFRPAMQAPDIPAFIPAAFNGRPSQGVPTSTANSTSLVMMAAAPTMLQQPIAAPAAPPAWSGEASVKRWSADGWLLLRPDARGSGSLLSSYGASQTGAVLRYRLAPGSGHRPAAYFRAAAALDGSRQREAAAGLSARPLFGLPLVVAAEMRLTSDRFATRTRPAVLAYTEIAPFDIAPGLRGEVYAQGGYVGGKGATAFVDGQLRVDRKLADVGRGELRLGGGVWGGAQEGASRLDAGPGLQFAFPLSQEIFARLAFDWRFRVAGNAAPASGPALTLSAGF